MHVAHFHIYTEGTIILKSFLLTSSHSNASNDPVSNSSIQMLWRMPSIWCKEDMPKMLTTFTDSTQHQVLNSFLWKTLTSTTFCRSYLLEAFASSWPQASGEGGAHHKYFIWLHLISAISPNISKARHIKAYHIFLVCITFNKGWVNRHRFP